MRTVSNRAKVIYTAYCSTIDKVIEQEEWITILNDEDGKYININENNDNLKIIKIRNFRILQIGMRDE